MWDRGRGWPLPDKRRCSSVLGLENLSRSLKRLPCAAIAGRGLRTPFVVADWPSRGYSTQSGVFEENLCVFEIHRRRRSNIRAVIDSLSCCCGAVRWLAVSTPRITTSTGAVPLLRDQRIVVRWRFSDTAIRLQIIDQCSWRSQRCYES